MSMDEEDFDAKYLDSILQRNPHLVTRLPIHPWRWRALAVWIVIFTLISFVALRTNREAINEVRSQKANIESLQRTNCALRDFLLSAAHARRISAEKDKDPVVRETDVRAAATYTVLAHKFGGRC